MRENERNLDLELREDDSEPVRRLKVMLKAAKAGKLTSLNGANKERDYSDIPDEVTVYAGL